MSKTPEKAPEKTPPLPAFKSAGEWLMEGWRIFADKWLNKKEGDGSSSLVNALALVLTVLGIICGIATYAALGTSSIDGGGDPDTVFWLLNIDLVILLILVVLVARRLVILFSGRRRGIAGSKLHVRLVFLFSLLAAAPAILMAVFSAFFFHYGIQSWFSERIQTAVTESQAVAEAYLEEHTEVIRADILGMANDLERQAGLLSGNDKALDRVIQTQSLIRDFSEAVLFDSRGRVLASAGVILDFDISDIPDEKMEKASAGEVAIMTGESEDRVRALLKLNNFVDTYLFVGRLVDHKVLAHVDATRQAVESYTKLEGARSSLQVTFLMIYVVVALLLLLAAIWLGLVYARRMVTPISSIISAAERVRAGDLTARVPDHEGYDEFDYLSRSFNRMTRQIQQQRDDLVQANRQLDDRRRFTETVLAGVSSGIIGIDRDGSITLANGIAYDLLNVGDDELKGQKIHDFLPDLEELVEQAFRKSAKIQQKEIPYAAGADADGDKKQIKTFLARVAVSEEDETTQSAVVTLDDITDLLSAQRKAAWSDVARRIAHEIKNPLTPIQLSAERLQRKYLKQIDTDQETFKNCVQTIIKHVTDIGHMVNEFSSFARMPEPVLKCENVSALVEDLIIFERQVHPHIRFNFIGNDPSANPVVTYCDGQKLRQALVNILQNAVEAIGSEDSTESGQIDVIVDVDKDNVIICVNDNGAGYPKDEDVTRLTDPYVTKRDKGTGLGLAIVKKIMEDHRGSLELGADNWKSEIQGWRDLGGASIVLTLPREQEGYDACETTDHISDNQNRKLRA